MGWAVCDLYWTMIKSDQDAGVHFAREATKGRMFTIIKTLGVILVGLILVFLLLAVIGCTSVDPRVSSTPEPEPTVVPTNTLEPTVVPTNTPEPTVAPTSTSRPSSVIMGPTNDWHLVEWKVGVEALSGLDNPDSVVIEAVLPPNTGLYLTTDPIGPIYFGEIEVFTSPYKGAVVGIYNATSANITLHLPANNWRENAKIFGMWGNIQAGEFEDFVQYVSDQQFGQDSSRGERKPAFGIFEITGEGVVERNVQITNQ